MESKAELLKTMRSPGFTLPALLFPVMFYIFFGILFKNGLSMPTYLLATYGTFGVIGPSLMSFGVGLAVERGQGWFALKEASPMPASAYIFAKIMITLLFSLVIVLLLFVVGAVFGEVLLMTTQWLTLALVLLVGSLPFCAIGLSLGMFLKSASAPGVVNLIYLPMSLLSGLWIPISFFPEAMLQIANLLPAFHLSQLALKVIDMDAGQNVWGHLLGLGLYFLVFTVLAMKLYYKKDKS